MYLVSKAFFLILILTMVANSSNGQGISEKELSGKWKVVNVIISRIPKAKEIETGKQEAAFLKSTFKFESDKYFTLTFENETEDPYIDKMEIYGAHWRLDQSARIVVITELKEKDSDKFDLMEIKIKQEGDKIFFFISDTFFKLEVEKIE